MISHYKNPLLTEEAFNYLQKAKCKYYDLPLTQSTRKQLTAHVRSGDSNSKIRLLGIYLFLKSNECLYVGSSINLGFRVNAYLKRKRTLKVQ